MMNSRNQIDEFSPVFKRKPQINKAVYRRKSAEFLKEQNCREKWRKRWSDFNELTSLDSSIVQITEEKDQKSPESVDTEKEHSTGECSVIATKKFKICEIFEFDIKKEMDSQALNADVVIHHHCPEGSTEAFIEAGSSSVKSEVRDSPLRLTSEAPLSQDGFLQISIYPSQQSTTSVTSLNNSMIENLNMEEKLKTERISDEDFNDAQHSSEDPSCRFQRVDSQIDNICRQCDASLMSKASLAPWNKLKLCKNGLTENLFKLHQRRSSDLSIWKRNRLGQSLDEQNECIRAEILNSTEEFGLRLLTCRKLSATSSPTSERIHVLMNCDEYKREKEMARQILVIYPPHRILVRKNLPCNVYVAWKFEID